MTLQLSVVIPTFERASMLDRCLSHLEAQDLPGDQFEVIVCDDASTDDTPAVGQAWERSGRLDLRYLRCPKGFAGAARNRGVASARAARVVFLGDDILAAPDLLRSHLEGAERHGPDSSLVGEVWLNRDEYTPFMEYLEETGVHHAFPQLHALGASPLRGWYFYACNASLPRAAFDAIGGFDESIYRAFEDGEFGFRLVRAGYRLYFLPEARGEHVHPTTVDRYVRFLRSGRDDIARVTEMAVSAGETAPEIGAHPLLDRLLSDRMTLSAARLLSRMDRLLPRRARWAIYHDLIQFERRRAYQAAGIRPSDVQHS